MINHRLCCALLALSILGVCWPQTRTDSVAIHFRQSKTALDTTYMDNASALEHIRELVTLYSDPDSALRLQSVEVVGGASPEGSVRINEYLSAHRAARILEYMQGRMPLPDSLTRSIAVGRDWHSLRSHVAADPSVPDRSRVLQTIDTIIADCERTGTDTDAHLQRLRSIDAGRPYLYMYRHIFPSLRYSDVVLTFAHPTHAVIEPLVTAPVAPILETVPSIIYRPMPLQGIENSFYMALKTNMIADALALPEIGAEFYVGKNLSVVANWMYGWWDKDSKHKYWRAYGGDLALRWWFGRAAHAKPLTGHHVGVYAGVVTYDFEFGGKGHMGGRPGHSLWDRCMHYAGIEYGYSLPIARRLNIDFTLGLGYMGGKEVEYIPAPCGNCYLWQATKQKHWIGPTKAEISLVWLIGHGNYNKKGAAR